VRREGKQIYIQFIHINIVKPDGLNCVCMKKDIVLTGNPANFSDRLNEPTSLLTYMIEINLVSGRIARRTSSGLTQSIFIHRQVGYRESFVFNDVLQHAGWHDVQWPR
jgi:hypothetical protein